MAAAKPPPKPPKQVPRPITVNENRELPVPMKNWPPVPRQDSGDTPPPPPRPPTPGPQKK